MSVIAPFPADSLSQRLAASTSNLPTSPSPSPIPADYDDSSEFETDTDDDALSGVDPYDYDATQALVLMVPILIPMLAKMAGRYVTISLMRKYFSVFV
ncbi:hypothetical protein HKX48_000189 [Thoreauomyces humboldtii]|nr:hypothetical protein HKX48_000189 [Thoreauomyces humboldtii]